MPLPVMPLLSLVDSGKFSVRKFRRNEYQIRSEYQIMKVQEFHNLYRSQFTQSQHDILTLLAAESVRGLWMGKGLDFMLHIGEYLFIRRGSCPAGLGPWEVKMQNEVNDVLEGWYWTSPETCATCRHEFYLRLEGWASACGYSLCGDCARRRT